MSKPLNIAIAGLGNVGASVIKLLQQNADLHARRTGRAIKVVAVSARDKKRDRGVDLSSVTWVDDPVALVDQPGVDIIVELMGGASGAAYDLVTSALKKGKTVITANKALLATKGADVLAAQKSGGGAIAFEAAVAGGIPVIKGLREGLSANKIKAVYGILNGTCNFILSEMAKTGRSFDDVLAEAQKLGYAEADPTFDVDGMDAAHKLAVLSALAFGCMPDVTSINVGGIRQISALDISFARELGFRIKLLGIARDTPRGVEQSVEPCLVPETTPVASVEGPLNAVYIDGDFSGKMLFTGAGAGRNATASAVVADIIDIARGHAVPMLGVAAEHVGKMKSADLSERMGSFYLRLTVRDEPGVVADISAILRDQKVSLESVLQRGRDPGQPVSIILTTHETRQVAMTGAVGKIAQLKSVLEKPHLMRIEDFQS
jgi:homoserine dehydrogenase